MKELIGAKFVADPAFEVWVNGDLVELTSLEHLLDTCELDVPGVGTIKVSQVDTKRTSRTSHPHGVAWWVNKRLVGQPSWDDFDEGGFLDRRTIEAKRYTFVVEADVLADAVEEDWIGFRNTQDYRAVHSAVKKHIRRRIVELMQDVHKERKRTALERNVRKLQGLPSDSRYYIGQTVDGLQREMPSLKQDVLTSTVDVLANLEETRSGYRLLEQLAELRPDELDDLSDILARWTIQEARVVLGELERRLKLIERLEQLVEDPSSDELHQIQPLFDRGLWIFGPQYESVHFTSNRTLLTVLRRLLGDDAVASLRNPRRRPDFVVLPDSTLGLYASDSFSASAEVNGVDKVLIIELKRGGTKIGIGEQRQGENYGIELRKSGKIQSSTKVVVFVLGTEVAMDAREPVSRGNLTVCARPYSVVLRQAHARTFHLLEKIRETRAEGLTDPDVEQVVSIPRQGDLLGSTN